MAVVFIFDVNFPEKDASALPPSSWQCAAELTNCGTFDSVIELWKDAKQSRHKIQLPLEEILAMWPDHVDQDESKGNPYALIAFPRTVMAKNKYFMTDIQPIVGYYRTSLLSSVMAKPCTSAAISNLAPLIQQTLQRCSNEQRGKGGGDIPFAHSVSAIPYGCIFTASLSQAPRDAIPWDAVPRGQALFSAVLVYHEDEDDLLRASYENAWRQECLLHEFEYIPHRSVRDGEGALEVVSAQVGSVGLLKGLLSGSSRVAQILCNTLWPSAVRQSLSEDPLASSPQASRMDEKATRAEVKDLNPANFFLVISSDFSMVLRSFTQPNASDGVDENGKVVVRPPTHLGQQDIRFLTLTKHDLERFPPSKHFSHLANKAIRKDHPIERLGINKDEEAHAGVLKFPSFPADPDCELEGLAMWEMAPLFLVNRYFSTSVAPFCVHPALFDSAMSDMLRVTLETAWRQDGFNPSLGIVFWPGDPPLRPVPLSTLLDQLVAFGIEDVKVVIPTSHKGAIPAQLTALEWQVCAEREVEVISLGGGALSLERGVDFPDLRKSESEMRELEDGVSGADRLREVLHCVTSWASMEATPKPLPWSHFTLTESPLDHNRCFLQVCAGSAQDEEIWARHFLSHALPSFSLSSCSDNPVASCLPSLSLVVHPDDGQNAQSKCSTTGREFVLSNKYFSTMVELVMYGGVCRQQWRQEAPLLNFLETCQAFIMLCTRESLHIASLGQMHQEYGGETPSDAVRPPAKHPRSPSSADLALTLIRVQELLVKQWKEEQEDLLIGSDGDGENEGVDKHAATALGNSSALKRIALLYIVDVDSHDTALMDEIFEEVHRILFGNGPNIKRCSNRDDINDITDAENVNFSLIEIVGMDLGSTTDEMGAVLHSNHADTFETEGCDRIREALEQHRWLFTQNVEAAHKCGNVTEPPKITKEEELDMPLVDDSKQPETELKPRDTLPNDDQRKETLLMIGCDPPPHYLMDPQSLRTEPVPALLHFYAKQNKSVEGDNNSTESEKEPNLKSLHNDFTKQKDSIENDAETVYYTELMAWVNRMKLYGDRLPPSVRRLQAEVLTLALGEALS